MLAIGKVPEFETMSRSLTFILAALVLMHATFGCCMHHAHSCEVDCCDAPAATAVDCPCRGHEDETVSRAIGVANDSSRDHDSHRCDGDACTAVVTQSSDDDAVNLADQPTAIVCGVAALTAVANAAGLRRPSGVVSSAPRLHLVLSVLLI